MEISIHFDFRPTETEKLLNSLAIPPSSYPSWSCNGLIWSFARHGETRSFTKECATGHWTLVLYSKQHWLHSYHTVRVWIKVFECTRSSKFRLPCHIYIQSLSQTIGLNTCIRLFFVHLQICLVVTGYSIHVIHFHLWRNSSFLHSSQARRLVRTRNILLNIWVKWNETHTHTNTK